MVVLQRNASKPFLATSPGEFNNLIISSSTDGEYSDSSSSGSGSSGKESSTDTSANHIRSSNEIASRDVDIRSPVTDSSELVSRHCGDVYRQDYELSSLISTAGTINTEHVPEKYFDSSFYSSLASQLKPELDIMRTTDSLPSLRLYSGLNLPDTGHDYSQIFVQESGFVRDVDYNRLGGVDLVGYPVYGIKTDDNPEYEQFQYTQALEQQTFLSDAYDDTRTYNSNQSSQKQKRCRKASGDVKQAKRRRKRDVIKSDVIKVESLDAVETSLSDQRGWYNLLACC